MTQHDAQVLGSGLSATRLYSRNQILLVIQHGKVSHSEGMSPLFQFPKLIISRAIPGPEGYMQILIPSPSQRHANTPPPAALKGSPYDVADSEMMLHPLPPSPKLNPYIQQIQSSQNGPVVESHTVFCSYIQP